MVQSQKKHWKTIDPNGVLEKKKPIPFNRFKNWPSFSSSYTKQILDKQIKCHIFLFILDCQDIYIGTKAARWGRTKLIRIKSGRSTIQIWRLKIEHVQRIKGDRDDSPILVEWTLCRWATCLSIHLLPACSQFARPLVEMHQLSKPNIH